MFFEVGEDITFNSLSDNIFVISWGVGITVSPP